MSGTSPLAIWRQPKYIISAQVFGGVASIVSGVGLITWATAVDLASLSGAGTYDSHDFGPTKNLVEHGPSDLTIANYVYDKSDFDFSIVEKAPLGIGNLTGIAMQYDHVKVIIKYGYTGSVFCHAAYGLIDKAATGIRQSPNTDNISFKPEGTPAYIGLFSGLPAAFG